MSSCPRKCWLPKRRPGDKREMLVWIPTRDARSREHRVELVEMGEGLEQMFPRREEKHAESRQGTWN